MPIGLPAKLVAWNRSLLNRCAYVSVNQAAGDVMFKIASELITTRAFTCKGSSNGTTAAMDGVFRWTNGNDAKTRFNGSSGAQSWVAITLAGGRGDVVFSYNAAADDLYAVWWSPGGLATVAGTATNEPTATDQVTLTKYFTSVPSTIVTTNAANDRLVSIWSRPDKGGFRVAVACNGTWSSLFGVDAITPDTYGAGITVTPAVAFYLHGTWDANANTPYFGLVNQPVTTSAANVQKLFRARRTNGAGTTLECTNKLKFVGQAAVNTALDPSYGHTFTPELQGGATYPMRKWGLYSVTASNRGDVGTLIDWYISRPAIADGDTAGALDWICVESTSSAWWDWDGSTAVVMS